MRDLYNISAGADPEVMLVSMIDGSPVSAEGMIGGSKSSPSPMIGLPDGFFVQEDNVAAEFNILPAMTQKDFTINIQKGLAHVRKLAKKQGLDVAVVSTMHFPKKMLSTPHAKLLGCEPDLCVWTGEPNPRPIPPESLRTAAGHVHIGWADADASQQDGMIKVLDVLLGTAALLVTEPNERRQLYGKAGAARRKWYGVEYRTLDNFWIAEKEYCDHVYSQVMRAVSWLNQGGDLLVQTLDVWGPEIQECINTHNIDMALRIMDNFSVESFPRLANAK